jgi:signal transduction histidine kinase
VSDPRAELRDRRTDRRVLFGTVLVVFIVFGVATVPQIALQSAMADGAKVEVGPLLMDIAQRILVNITLLAAVFGVLALLRPLGHRGPRVLVDALIAAIAAGLIRAPLQVLRGQYSMDDLPSALIESFTVFLLALVMVVVGLEHVAARRRIREQERASMRQTLIASAALDALAAEELRVRRDVAEGLHGTVQQNLVVLAVRVDAVAERLATIETACEDVDELRDIRESIDRIRETDVRTLSQLLYPVGMELGAVAALRLLLQRLPGTIASTISISDDVLQLEGNGNTVLSVDRRLLIVRIAEEALSNALRHGRASAVRLELTLDDGAIVLVFDDDGFGLGPSPSPSGLARFSERLHPIGGTIEFGDDSPLGGARLIARVPANRAASAGSGARQAVPQLAHERRDDSLEAAAIFSSDSELTLVTGAAVEDVIDPVKLFETPKAVGDRLEPIQ